MSAVALLWLTAISNLSKLIGRFTYTPWYVFNCGALVRNSSGAHVLEVAEF